MQFLLRDLLRLPRFDGLNSGLYSLFTATFWGIGLAFIFSSEPTKAGMFGSTVAMTASHLFLWRLLGAAVALIVGPVASTQQVSASLGEELCCVTDENRILLARPSSW